MQGKKCSKCQEWKPATSEFFNINRGGLYGLRGQCKPCWQSRVRVLIKQPEIIASRKRSYENYRDSGESAKRSKEWRDKNLSSARESARKSRVKHKDSRKEADAAWKAANPDKVKAYRRITAQRQQQNPAYVLHKRTKARLRAMLKDLWVGKTEEILGYSRAQLVAHIESLFEEGMSWEILMTGAIHIDHVRPVSSFKILGTDCPEFKACWTLSNLRPMWALDNQKKSNKWERTA